MRERGKERENSKEKLEIIRKLTRKKERLKLSGAVIERERHRQKKKYCMEERKDKKRY